MTGRCLLVCLSVLGVVALQGCVYKELGRSCAWSDTDLSKVDGNALGMVFGAPASRFADTPIVMLYTPSQANPVATLEFKLTPAPVPWPASLDETPCKGVDWRTFQVAVEPDQWTKFWALPRPMPFYWGFGFSNSTALIHTTAFGVALVNEPTGEVLMSCGCYRP